MHKTQAKIQSMSTAEWHAYHQLLTSQRLMDYFADEILRFTHSTLKPDDVFRRFSLNGDGQLDFKEFQLALKRLGMVDGTDGTDATRQRRSHELFSVFCPANNKKLDIDLFCRILTEWSLQLLRAQHDQHAPSSSLDFQSPSSTLPTPYATAPASGRSAVSYSEGETIWRRIRDAVVLGLDKLRQIFAKMDISSTGRVSPDEFALALSHIGVLLTAREFEKLYDALPTELKESGYDTYDSHDSSASRAIRYADFLASIQQQHPDAAKPGLLLPSSQNASPPIATNARLWDLLVLALDRLEPLIQQYERARQRCVTAETFRDVLTRCGITLSNSDFAALRVRLLSCTDTAGAINLAMLLQALKAHDQSAMASSVRSSTFTNAAPPSHTALAPGTTTISPIRTGRKTVFSSRTELTPPASLYESSRMGTSGSTTTTGTSTTTTSALHAAGKSNEQRNSEANRSMIKVRDESRWNSHINFETTSSDPPGTSKHSYTEELDEPGSSPLTSAAVKPLALERRILTKLQQLKDVGQLGSASPQSVFPGDRFGRITRGQLRQSLVHLGLVARHAEVESLFWTLDPSGRGYVTNHDLYDHLNNAATKLASLQLPETASGSTNNWTLPSLSPTATTNSSSTGLPRSVQKIFEAMLLHVATLLATCQRYDVHRTGLVSRGELTAAIHELGVLASPQDVQTAIVAMTQRVELMSRSPRRQNQPQQEPPVPLAEPYHPHGIVYTKLETRLQQLCSDLLSPKRRRQHLSTASVLLAPQETQAFANAVGAASDNEFNMNMANETDALWNCPRRRMNQDHPATKSSIQITDQIYDDSATVRRDNSPFPTTAESSGSTALASLPRGRRLTVLSILQDLLEHRGELKSVVDLHRHADVHGQVRTTDLAEILMASRLSLNFSNALPSGITAREFVDLLYPSRGPDPQTVSFLELLHRISDLLHELTRVTPAGANTTATGLYGNNAYPRETVRRMHTTSGVPGLAYSPILLDPVQPSPRTAARSPRSGGSSNRTLSLFASDELSLQRKLLYESRLSDLLTSEKGRQSAAVLIRHAFKGVMARELVVPIDSGEFEAVCRASDLKHVCFRLGLDLDVGELQFLTSSIDVNQSGYVSSPQLLQFFSHLATRAASGSGSGATAAAAAVSFAVPRDERLDSARTRGVY